MKKAKAVGEFRDVWKIEGLEKAKILENSGMWEKHRYQNITVDNKLRSLNTQKRQENQSRWKNRKCRKIGVRGSAHWANPKCKRSVLNCDDLKRYWISRFGCTLWTDEFWTATSHVRRPECRQRMKSRPVALSISQYIVRKCGRTNYK